MGCCSATLREDKDYDPSPLTLKFGTSSTTDYKKQDNPTIYTGDAKVLVVCTDDGRMAMQNGKVFSTGNHPVEMLLPMLHFRDAGLSFDFATTTGGPVVLEMWAFPNKDEAVKGLHNMLKPQMDAPLKIEDIKSLDGYAGIFIPGGHGAMINLPKQAALGNLLRDAQARKMPTITLCHGPAALLSTGVEGKFAYDGYKIMCFTDKTDAFTPKLGYLPGKMPWKCQSTLEGKGITVLNQKETGAVNQDRELLTGDSPQAGQNLGVLAAPIVAKYAIENYPPQAAAAGQ